MLIIKTPNLDGVNPLFPTILRARRGKIIVFNWDTYKSRFPIIIALNCSVLVFAAVYYIGTSTSSVQTAMAAALVVSVIYRTYATKAVTINVNSIERTIIAPWYAWVEYWMHLIGCLLTTLSAVQFGSDPIRLGAYIVSSILLVLITIPFVNVMMRSVFGRRFGIK